MIFLLRLFYRIVKFISYRFFEIYSGVITRIKFNIFHIEFKKFQSNGVPYLHVAGSVKIGNNFKMNNGMHFNVIGRQQPCIFNVIKGATLLIGENVGISSTAIVCHKSITIGNDVKIGGNVVIYDTDFHSLNANERNHIPEIYNTKQVAVFIEDGVFIGAHSIILKGVTIGRNSIIAAGSVVTKSIPANQIWGGNPAAFIKDTDR